MVDALLFSVALSFNFRLSPRQVALHVYGLFLPLHRFQYDNTGLESC